MWVRIIVTTFAIISGFFATLNILFNVCWNGLSVLTVKKRQMPAILNDAKYGTHKYMNLPKTGVNIHYVERGNPSKKLLVFVHGFPDFWFSWRHQIVELSKKYRTISIDGVGCGESDKPGNIGAYQIKEVVAVLAEFIQCTGDKCILVTHDGGSICGFELVQKFPNLVEKHIAINGPTFESVADLIGRNFKQTLWSHYAYFFQVPYLPEIMLRMHDMKVFDKLFVSSSEEEIECYKYYYGQPGGFTYPLFGYKALPLHRPIGGPIEKVPTLIIWGQRTKILVPEVPEKLRSLGDHVTVNYLPNSGHNPHIDQSTLVNQLIGNFIAAVSS